MEIQRAIDNLSCMKMEIQDTADIKQAKSIRINTINVAIAALKEKQNKLWIPVSEQLPEDGINPVTCDFYEYEVTFKSDNIYDVRHYAFGRGHWWDCGQCMDDFVIAWRERPEPYKSQNLAYADNDTAQPGLQSAT